MSIPKGTLYCELDGHPCLVGEKEAWIYRNAVWTKVSLAAVAMDSRVVGVLGYGMMFGKLPPLPAEAFTV